MTTKDKIVEKALELYNEHGIEYVGVRELAKELDMKGGNITYYFPTKDDIIAEIARRLAAENNVLFREMRSETIAAFLDSLRAIYANQYKYRAMFISLPHLVMQNRGFAAGYKKNRDVRKKTIEEIINGLVEKKILQPLSPEEVAMFTRLMVMINRFWISESIIDQDIITKEKLIATYVELIANTLKVSATAKGRKEIDQYLENRNKRNPD